MRPDKGIYETTLGVEFRGLASLENFSSSDYRRFRDETDRLGPVFARWRWYAGRWAKSLMSDLELSTNCDRV